MYADPERQREYNRDWMRRQRAAVRAEKAGEPAPDPLPPKDPAAAVAAWSARRLKVPPGHKNAGKPMRIPAYIEDFLADALRPGVREAGLFVARKGGKSAGIAILLLAHLAEDGPLRRRGWRGSVASVSKDKAGELWQQVSDICESSGLEGIRCGIVPRMVKSEWGKVDFLSADKNAGHSSGFDIAIADEIGLFPPRGRDLVNGLKTSVSARDGRLLAISVLGDSALSAEMVERADDPATVVHVHAAPDGCALDDPAAWRAANPTLGDIKSLSYMRDMARAALATPADQADFRCFDLNQPGQGGQESIVPLDRWQFCAGKPQPKRSGPCYVGIDIGGAASMTAAAAYWPDTGRMECYGAFGDTPDLAARGQGDGVKNAYVLMADAGELLTFPGRVTPCGEFLAWLAGHLEGEDVRECAADRYKRGEALDAMDAAKVFWRMDWRAQGSGPDGSADVRAFQRAVMGGSLRPGDTMLMLSAINAAIVRKDGNGNPSLDKKRSRGRIDPLSASVLAVGLGARHTAAEPSGVTVTHYDL